MANILAGILGAGDLIKEIGSTVRQVLPNKEAQRDFDLKIAEIADKADERETSLIQGQIDVNKAEASNSNLFVAGARPFIVWVCGIGIAIEFVVRPLAVAVGAALFPHIDSNLLLGLLVPILGLGTMRTVEKMKGVATGQQTNTTQQVQATPGLVSPAPPVKSTLGFS